MEEHPLLPIDGTPVDKRTDGPGVTRIDANDPAAPMYRLLAEILSPVTLRDMMILPVRTGYAGQTPPAGPEVIPRWDHMFPDGMVEEIGVPSPDDAIRCLVSRAELETC
jgi:acetyl esterase